MPNTIGAVLPGTLLAQIEVATIAAAGAAYIKNPVAGRAILQAAAIALFTPPVGPALVAAVAVAVAAYALSQWGPDVPPNQTRFANWTVRDTRFINTVTYTIQFPTGIATQTASFSCGNHASKTTYVLGPTVIGNSIYGPNQLHLNNTVQPLYGTSTPVGYVTAVSVVPCTGSAYTPTLSPGFPDLTTDDVAALEATATVTIPRTIPRLPLPENNPGLILPPLITQVGTDVLDCCLEQQTFHTEDQTKLDLILARVRQACINLGLPDLDGTNTGAIEGQDEEFYYTLSSSIQELLRAVGRWPSNATTRFNSDDLPYSSVRYALDTIKDRLNYDELEDTPTPDNPDQQAGDVQEHIRFTKWEGQDASFHVGYADSAPARNIIKIIFTDTTKYRSRQNAQMIVPNPKPDLTNAQIKDAIPVRILGPYWCTLLLADKTKLVGWFPSSIVGQTQLTDLAALTVSGVSSPVRFTTTLKGYGVPDIAGTSLTPTGYAYNRLNSDGTFTLITQRI